MDNKQSFVNISKIQCLAYNMSHHLPTAQRKLINLQVKKRKIDHVDYQSTHVLSVITCQQEEYKETKKFDTVFLELTAIYIDRYTY